MQQTIQKLIDNITGTHPDPDTDLFDSGVLDSLSTMQLITDMERELDIQIDVDDFRHDNFQTVDAIVLMVKGYRT